MKSVIDGDFNLANVTPEQELLLRCARVAVTGENRDRIRECAARVGDWGAVTDLCGHHTVTSLVYFTLKNHVSDMVPGQIMEQFRRGYYYWATRSMKQALELCRILSLFDRRNIPAVPLKGPVMARLIYGNESLRASNDLDILVRKEDFIAACELLMRGDARYAYRIDGPDIGKDRLRLFIKSNSEIEMKNRAGNMVDIHCRSRHKCFSFPVDLNALRHRLKIIPYQNMKISVFSPEDLFWYLCSHFDAHAMPRGMNLKLICDINELVRANPGLDWRYILQVARKAGRMRSVLFMTAISRMLLDTPLPPDVLRETERNGPASRLANDFCKEFFCEPARNSEAMSLELKLRLRERLSHKIRLSLYIVSPQLMDYQAIPYPCHFLAYFHKWLRKAAHGRFFSVVCFYLKDLLRGMLRRKAIRSA